MTLPPDDLIADRYEKGLIFRLIGTGERLLDEYPALAEETGFRSAWEILGQMTPGLLARVVRVPLLDRWVAIAEYLDAQGLFKRYPRAHPSRHLKEFSHIVGACAESAPDGSASKLPLPYRRSIPMRFGTVVLFCRRETVLETLSWRTDGTAVLVEGPDRRPIARVESSSGEIEVCDDGWEVRRLPQVESALVDVWTHEYLESAPAGLGEDELVSFLESGLGLVEDARTLIGKYVRVVTSGAASRWTAGLLRPGVAAADGGRELLELALRDRAQRLLSMHPVGATTGAGTDLESLLVRLSAKRSAGLVLGDQGLDGEQEELWQRLEQHVLASESGAELIHQLIVGGPTDSAPPGQPGPERAASGPSPPPSDGLLRLSESAAATVVESPRWDQLMLRKTRRGVAYRPDDWSAMDQLFWLPADQLRKAAQAAAPQAAESEADAFCNAIFSYLLGDFDESYEAVIGCLHFDSDVEEYWHLLAFSLRHLGMNSAFDRIMIDGIRDLDFAQSCYRTRSGG